MREKSMSKHCPGLVLKAKRYDPTLAILHSRFIVPKEDLWISQGRKLSTKIPVAFVQTFPRVRPKNRSAASSPQRAWPAGMAGCERRLVRFLSKSPTV